jgi:hypothetical protein
MCFFQLRGSIDRGHERRFIIPAGISGGFSGRSAHVPIVAQEVANGVREPPVDPYSLLHIAWLT